jgi:hypothetical protein
MTTFENPKRSYLKWCWRDSSRSPRKPGTLELWRQEFEADDEDVAAVKKELEIDDGRRTSE